MFEFGDHRLPIRFWQKVTPEPASGCWLWTASDNGNGYGQFQTGTRRKPNMEGAHRVAYEALVDKVPQHMQLDHLCRVRCCVNPHHMEVVTQTENLRRSVRKPLVTCQHGHEYTRENTYINSAGYKECLSCRRQRNRTWWRNNRGRKAKSTT